MVVKSGSLRKENMKDSGEPILEEKLPPTLVLPVVESCWGYHWANSLIRFMKSALTFLYILKIVCSTFWHILIETCCFRSKLFRSSVS